MDKVRWILTEEDFDKDIEDGYWVEKMRQYLGQIGRIDDRGLVVFEDETAWLIPPAHLERVN
jgi:hypothetical protein